MQAAGIKSIKYSQKFRSGVSLQADLPESAFRHVAVHAGGAYVSVEPGLRSTRFHRTTKRTPA